MTKNKLSEGVAGSKIVAFFAENHAEEGVPVDAESLGGNTDPDSMNYRITFDNERVSDWRIQFAGEFSLDITSAEKYNEVI